MTQSNNSYLEYSFSKESAFSGSDVRAFIMPTFTNHSDPKRPIFNTPDPELLEKALKDKQNLDYYLNQSYITNLSGVSLSTHRDKTPIVSLGRTDPLGFVASRRTVAGSMVFWMSDASPLSQLLSADYRSELLHAGELPPFDLHLTFTTENDMWSSATIYGITILDEGMVIESANGEPIAVTYSYMATDCSPVTSGYFNTINPITPSETTKLFPTISAGSVSKNTETKRLELETSNVDLNIDRTASKIDPRNNYPTTPRIESFIGGGPLVELYPILSRVPAKYTLTYIAGSHGTLFGISVQTVMATDDGSTIQAIPDTGYKFANWSDAVADNPRTDKIVTKDINVTAYFEANNYTLTYVASANGMLFGKESQSVPYLGNGSPIEAIADSEYTFARWSDGSTVNPRTDTGITKDINVTAYFIQNQENE